MASADMGSSPNPLDTQDHGEAQLNKDKTKTAISGEIVPEAMDCGDADTVQNVTAMPSRSANASSDSKQQHKNRGDHMTGHDAHWDNNAGMSYQKSGYADGRQQQMQHQMFRSAQASKQMVYEVFGNCITMLEELEAREQNKQGLEPLPRSDIHLPDQKQFDNATIQRKLDTQLLLLQCQLMSCNEEIKDEVKDELKENTLQWISKRDHDNIPDGDTDTYTGKLFELLQIGKIQHPEVFSQPPTIGEKDMQNAMQGFVAGNHRKSNLDKEFKEKPDKKASKLKLRNGAGIDKGADRLAKKRPDLAKHIDSYRSSLM